MSLREIADDVAWRHGVTLAAMRSPSRLRKLSHARHEFWWRARQETRQSYPAIARFMGGFDHTSAMSGVRAHEARLHAVNEVGKSCAQPGNESSPGCGIAGRGRDMRLGGRLGK